jgi:hypothetical protein
LRHDYSSNDKNSFLRSSSPLARSASGLCLAAFELLLEKL